MKGDFVEVVTAVGASTQTTRITATKAGRTVTSKFGAKWLDIAEASRSTAANPKGRPTGNSIRVRVEAIVSVEVRREDAEDVPPFRAARSDSNSITVPSEP